MCHWRMHQPRIMHSSVFVQQAASWISSEMHHIHMRITSCHACVCVCWLCMYMLCNTDAYTPVPNAPAISKSLVGIIVEQCDFTLCDFGQRYTATSWFWRPAHPFPCAHLEHYNQPPTRQISRLISSVLFSFLNFDYYPNVHVFYERRGGGSSRVWLSH